MIGAVIFDVVMSALSLAGGFMGWHKGFFAIVSSIAGYIFGFLFSLMLCKPLAFFVRENIQVAIMPVLLSFLCYYALFFVGYLMVRWIGSAVSLALERMGLSKVEDAMGFLLGCAEAVLILFVIVTVLRMQPFYDLSHIFDSSLFCKWVVSAVGALFRVLLGGAAGGR